MKFIHSARAKGTGRNVATTGKQACEDVWQHLSRLPVT